MPDGGRARPAGSARAVGGQRLDQLAHQALQLREALVQGMAALVHEQAAAQLDLQGVAAMGRLAVALGDVAAGIGPVARDPQARGREQPLGGLDQARVAAAAEPIAQRHVDRPFAACRCRQGRHGVAVEDQGRAEAPAVIGHQCRQLLVIGSIGGRRSAAAAPRRSAGRRRSARP